MHTYQIGTAVLDDYTKDKLSEERINFLTTQANEQLDEISQNEEMYNSFLKQVDAPKKVDKLVLWILFMSDEMIARKYARTFDKGFRNMIPISDLADLLLYLVHLQKVKNIEVDGFEYLLESEKEGIEEVDQFSFTNAILYIQRLKEVKMEF